MLILAQLERLYATQRTDEAVAQRQAEELAHWRDRVPAAEDARRAAEAVVAVVAGVRDSEHAAFEGRIAALQGDNDDWRRGAANSYAS